MLAPMEYGGFGPPRRFEFRHVDLVAKSAHPCNCQMLWAFGSFPLVVSNVWLRPHDHLTVAAERGAQGRPLGEGARRPAATGQLRPARRRRVAVPISRLPAGAAAASASRGAADDLAGLAVGGWRGPLGDLLRVPVEPRPGPGRPRAVGERRGAGGRRRCPDGVPPDHRQAAADGDPRRRFRGHQHAVAGIPRGRDDDARDSAPPGTPASSGGAPSSVASTSRLRCHSSAMTCVWQAARREPDGCGCGSRRHGPESTSSRTSSGGHEPRPIRSGRW